MTGTPVAGWYTDPGQANQLRYWDGNSWTSKILASESSPGAGTPRRGLPAIGIVGIVAAGLLAVGGITAILLNSDDEPDASREAAPASPFASPTPSPEATTPDPIERTAPEVIVPEGWELFVSRSGAVEYAYDPEWTDIWSPEYEQMMIDSIGIEDTETEAAGSWMLNGSPFTGGTNLVVIATSGGIPIGPLQLAAEGFVAGTAYSSDLPYEITFSEGLTMRQGYDAWRTDYTMTEEAETLYSSVVVFEYGVITGFVYLLSIDPFDQWIPDYLAVVDSLVLVKPPINP